MSKYTHIKGRTFSSTETIVDQDGAVVDLTGATVVFTIVDRNGTSVASLTATLTTPLSGICTVSETASNTAAWPMGYFDTDLKATLSGGAVYSEKGNIEIRDNIDA